MRLKLAIAVRGSITIEAKKLCDIEYMDKNRHLLYELHQKHFTPGAKVEFYIDNVPSK